MFCSLQGIDHTGMVFTHSTNRYVAMYNRASKCCLSLVFIDYADTDAKYSTIATFLRGFPPVQCGERFKKTDGSSPYKQYLMPDTPRQALDTQWDFSFKITEAFSSVSILITFVPIPVKCSRIYVQTVTVIIMHPKKRVGTCLSMLTQ